MNLKCPLLITCFVLINASALANDPREIYFKNIEQSSQIASMERRIKELNVHANNLGANDYIKTSKMEELVKAHSNEMANYRKLHNNFSDLEQSLNEKEQEVFTLNTMNQELVDHANDMSRKMQDAFIEMQKMKFQQSSQGRTPASTIGSEKVTFSIADLFKEGKLDIDPREKRELKQFIEKFISSNIKKLNHNKKINFVTFSKPSANDENYIANLSQSMTEGATLASYIMSDDFGDFSHKEQFVSHLVVSGVASKDGVQAQRAPASKSECGIYDCLKSHRIELSIK